MELTENEIATVKKVVDEMRKCGLFVGKFDAKNGNVHFMYGISTVMDYLSSLVSEEYFKECEEEFLKNFDNSLKEGS